MTNRRLAATVGYRPLYQQVREQLVQRLASGLWQPGSALPSEQQLAAELQVSQGTVRKALDEMSADNLLVRRQGRGTYVARHGEGPMLFQFFKLIPDHDAPVFPDSRVLSCARIAADAATRHRLDLAEGAQVVRIRRFRWLDAGPCMAETICVPAIVFPGLETQDLPNNLYAFYSSRYAVTIGGGNEKLKAVVLSVEDAAMLNAAPGTPALQVDRVATSLEGQKIEWRLSLCLTQDMHYLTQLK